MPALVQQEGKPPLQVRTLDICASGLSLASAVALEAGSRCRVTFILMVHGRQHTLHLNASVVYSVLNAEHGFKVGLHFSASPPQDVSVIEQYVQR